MWKENCMLLMLPTSDTSAPLCKDIKYLDVQMSEDFESMEYPRHQHLYVVSHEEVLEGEWCLEIHNGPTNCDNSIPRYTDSDGNTWYLRELNMNYSNNKSIMFRKEMDGSCMKVIATTDKSLGLPLIPYRLTHHFQIRYNTPSPIESILVEYASGGTTRCHKRAGGYDDVANKDTIVVNEDNTINSVVLYEPKPEKYTEEEVINLLKKFKNDNCYSICFDDNQFENWAAKNLKK